MVVTAQQLSHSMLRKVPGAEDLLHNLQGRVLLGPSSHMAQVMAFGWVAENDTRSMSYGEGLAMLCGPIQRIRLQPEVHDLDAMRDALESSLGQAAAASRLAS